MPAVRTGVVWIDAQGERTLNIITTRSGASSIVADIDAASNAGIDFTWEAVETAHAPAASVATYPTVRVSAQLLFKSATGSLARLYIPAPVASIFSSDGVTVDPNKISTLIADAVGNLICGDSTTASEFFGGQLYQSRISGIASLQVYTP